MIYRVFLYVDKNMEAEEYRSSLPKFNEQNEKIHVGSNPFPNQPKMNRIYIKKLVYFPNTLPILNLNTAKGRNINERNGVTDQQSKNL